MRYGSLIDLSSVVWLILGKKWANLANFTSFEILSARFLKKHLKYFTVFIFLMSENQVYRISYNFKHVFYILMYLRDCLCSWIEIEYDKDSKYGTYCHYLDEFDSKKYIFSNINFWKMQISWDKISARFLQTLLGLLMLVQASLKVCISKDLHS